MLAHEQLNTLYQKGLKALQFFRKNAISPNESKVLRTWGISDTAKMVGRSPQTLRNLEENGKIPKAKIITKNKKDIRTYTLAEINIIREILDVRPSKPAGKDALILGVTNFKGGVAKSFTALALAQALALLGFKILLVDGDSQGTATHVGGGFIPDLHIEMSQTLLNILIGKESDISQCIFKTHWDGLDIIPANLSLYNSEMIVPQQIFKHKQETGEMLPFYKRLLNAVNQVKNNYDVVIFDTPPSLGFVTINVLYALNGMIIPLQASEVDFCSTIQFLGMATEALDKTPREKFDFTKFLITRYKNTAQASDMKNVIEKVWFGEVFENRMLESEAVAKSFANLQTIYETEPHPNDKKTYKRATSFVNAVAEEVMASMYKTWDVDKQSQPTMSLSEVI